jgi:hypothetical protein
MLLLVPYGIPSSWEKIENNSLRDTEDRIKEFKWYIKTNYKVL